MKERLGSSSFNAVITVLAAFLVFALCRSIYQHRLDQQFASQRGCQPVKRWSAKWPQGLDLLLKVFKYARRQQILRFFLDVVGESGTTFEQVLLGARAIGTVEPRNIEAVLSTQFAEFGLGLRPPTFAPLLGSGIFTQDGAQWKHSRDLLRPQFTSNRSQNFEQIRECVKNLMDCVPKDGIVDLQPLFFRLTFDTTTFLLFGTQLSSLKGEGIAGQESDFALAFNLGQDYLAHRGRLGNLYWLWGGQEFRDACRTCHAFVDAAVQKALEPSATPGRESYVFLDALVKETRDPKVLRDQCLNILLAGRDTTACCLSWTFRLLARHQEVLDKLRAEIQSVVGLGEDAPLPTMTDIKKMTYLNLILKEVLRLYPSVPVNSRAALKTTTLPTGGGQDGKSPILVRRGEAVGYSVYAMHRRRDIYGPDAEAFRPERWENNRLKDVGWGYLPFNGGPRVCLGQDFAMLEAGYALARIVQCFPGIRPVEGEEESDVPIGMEKQALTLVVACAEGCRVQMRRQ